MSSRWQGEGAQHQGARPYQEDSWALRTLPDGSLLAIVADGMGGHIGGAIASKLVIDAVVTTIERGGSLSAALHAANAAVGQATKAKPELSGMGSTLVAALVTDDRVRWISVGDSPFYFVSKGGIDRLNADHSMAPQIDALLKRGLLTAEEAANHPGRHTLREAVMGDPLTLIDEGERQLGSGVLLLCSDGVHSIEDAVLARQARLPVQHQIDRVLAAKAPHQDNITIIKLERSS